MRIGFGRALKACVMVGGLGLGLTVGCASGDKEGAEADLMTDDAVMDEEIPAAEVEAPKKKDKKSKGKGKGKKGKKGGKKKKK